MGAGTPAPLSTGAADHRGQPGMGDYVVDGVELSSHRSADSSRNPGGRHPQVARRLRHGETALGHRLHREPGPHLRNPPPSAPQAELFQADLPALADSGGHLPGLAQPPLPRVLLPQPLICLLQHPLHKPPAAQDPFIRQGPCLAPTHRSDLGPAAQRPDQSPADELGAPAPRGALLHVPPVDLARPGLRSSEPGEDVAAILPPVVDSTQHAGMPTPGIPAQVGQSRHHPGPGGIEMDVSHELAEVRGLLADNGFVAVLKKMPIAAMPAACLPMAGCTRCRIP